MSQRDLTVVLYHFNKIRSTTAGERLFHWLAQSCPPSLAREMPLREHGNLKLTGRPICFGGYIEGSIVAFSFSRLMALGKHHFNQSNDVAIGLTSLRRDLKDWFYWLPKDDIDLAVRYVKAAVDASDKNISQSTADLVYGTRRAVHCYMCGTRLDRQGNTFADATGQRASLDHLWPSSLGGDSSGDNLLPACVKCNVKKAHLLTWEDGHAHGAVFGVNYHQHPEFPKYPLLRKIEVHRRAAFNLAQRKGLTLKLAFSELGPFGTLRAVVEDDTWDFFNLENHSEALELTLWEPS